LSLTQIHHLSSQLLLDDDYGARINATDTGLQQVAKTIVGSPVVRNHLPCDQ